MKTFFFSYIVIFILTLSCPAYSQQHEIGISAGGLNYTGDLSPDYSFYYYGQSLMAFYKYNFSPAFGLKLGMLEGQFEVNDDLAKDPMPKFRNTQSNTMIVEFSAIGEYNFLDYRKNNSQRRFTPYLSGGGAFYIYSQNSPDYKRKNSDGTGFSIPFGVGLRYQAGKQVNIGLEFIARKTFTDNLDGLSDRLISGKQVGDKYSDDWYYFTGFTLSYTFYGVKCPEIFH